MKNAAANLARGGAAALVALLLPPILVRVMPVERYGVWVLILQISAYLGYLDFGIQTAVGRFVAHANEKNDAAQRDGIVSTAAALLTAAGTLGVILLVLLAWQMPHLFRQMPPGLYGQARVCLLLVGGSLAIGLPASVFTGVFVGKQRFEVPALILGGGKLLGGVLVAFAAWRGLGLVPMAALFAGAGLATSCAQYVAARRFAPEVRVSSRLVSRAAARELFSYCASLSVWQFAMLLVTGLDTTIVGYFDFPAVAYYAVAATLVMFIGGLESMVFGVLMPEAAVMNARGEASLLGRVLIKTMRYGMFGLLLTGVPLIVAAKLVLTVWVGARYAHQGALLLQVLTAANMIRLSLIPYSTLLIGTGQQRLTMLSAILEGVSNLLISLIGGYYLGAIGVAWGTMAGAVVGVCGGLFYNIPRTKGIQVSTASVVWQGIALPLLCFLPLVVLCCASQLPGAPSDLLTYGFWIGSAVVAVAIWRWGINADERKELHGLAARLRALPRRA